jgi:3-hydroxybutyryl-CoA dehydratase
MTFAGMSGDFFDVHMDDDFARAQGFPGPYRARPSRTLPGRRAQEPCRSVQLQAVASLGWKRLVVQGPDRGGDSIGATITVEEMRLTSSGDRGIVHLGFEVRNQDGVIVQSGRNALLMRRNTGGIGPCGENVLTHW